MATSSLKHLSSVASDFVHRCALKLGISVEELVEEFEEKWKPENGSYSKKMVVLCSEKALAYICENIQQDINDGSFSRFTFDMMLAWQNPNLAEEEDDSSFMESVAKEKEDMKPPPKIVGEQDEISLFYSDLMPLLVDNEGDVGEDAFVWLGTLCPLIADVVNGRFIFEILTAPTSFRLHFPAYDKFLKEIDRCIQLLQDQTIPNGVVLADDEFILRVEGTTTTQRVVRHIGPTSWPGRLTLTNYALYFEPSSVVSYKNAIKIDLSKNTDHTFKRAATGPWGAPLFDKAIVYDSPEISEGIILEFPEMTSSTRRDHWLALTNEIVLLHRFLSKFNVKCPIRAWEMHARTILGMTRLHASRELLRISPPPPTKFLIFALCDELPKGDYVLEELAESLKNTNSRHPSSANSVLRSMITRRETITGIEIKRENEEFGRRDRLSSLEIVVNQAREEEKEMFIAKATAEGLKEEGIAESALIFVELVKPIHRELVERMNQVIRWEKPAITLAFMSAAVMIIYKEWIGKAIAALLLWVVAKMVQARRGRVAQKWKEMIVCTASEQSTMENIVSAQQGLQTLHAMVQTANLAILKIWSIFVSRAPKHSNMVMMGLIGMAIVVAIVPMKVIIMAIILYSFTANSRIGGKYMESKSGNRRFKEWWDSVPVIHVKLSRSAT